jgi:two-component system phosphate regulon sensor histidine kinase PhoR
VSRGRHLLTTALIATPLLVLCLVLAAGSSAAWLVVVAAAWSATVLVVDAVHWSASAAPLVELADELHVKSTSEVQRALVGLRRSSAICEEERSRAVHLLEDLSSGLGDGLLVVTADLHIRLINPVAIRFCGLERVAPRTLLVEIFRDPSLVGAVQSAASGGSPDPVVVENARGLWEVHAFPLRNGGAVVLLSDVGLVRKAAELRRRFVQDLSHELRSPLTVLRTTVEASEGEVSDELSARLVHQVERIDRLTSELYELASIEAGQVELQLERVNLAATAREVAVDLQPESEAAEVLVRLNLAEDLHCWCDRRGIYRVLRNLVDNAIKYNRPGGWVAIRGRSEAGTTVLEVEDNGEGIPPSEHQAVLQRFYRVDRARTPGDGGLGLGLAIVKHMVMALDGTLELDSREGVGTTFTVRLPSVPDGDSPDPAF